MTRETMQWLNNNTLIGFTAKRGNAWHRNASLFDGDLDNHYVGAIPAEDILSRLFSWSADETPVYVPVAATAAFASGREIIATLPDGRVLVAAEGRKAVTRSDNAHVMGIHSEGYNGHAYGKWLVDETGKLVGDAQYANAGLLRGGSVAWVQVEVPENVTTSGGVTFRPSILAGTSFDGSLATFYKPVVTNVVCDNTMAAGMAEDGTVYRRKHTRNSAFVIADARAALDMIEATAEKVAAEIDALTNTEVSDKAWSAFIAAHVPDAPKDASKRAFTMVDNKRAALTGLWRTDIRVAPWNGTAWGVVQAVNTYNEHMATVKGVADRFERKMLNAISDVTSDADKMTVKMLGEVMGRELLAV